MRVPALLALAAALALPAGATAKEVSALDVCGTDGCTHVAGRAALQAFEQGGDMAAAAPSAPQRSYLVRVRMRHESGGSESGWTDHWLPAAGLLAYEEPKGQFIFTTVDGALERVLRRAARGRTARAARRYVRTTAPVAQVDEVLAPPRAAAQPDGGRLPALAWVGVAAGVLLLGGAVRARRT